MKKSNEMQLQTPEIDPLDTPTDLSRDAVGEISTALRQLLADVDGVSW